MQGETVLGVVKRTMNEKEVTDRKIKEHATARELLRSQLTGLEFSEYGDDFVVWINQKPSSLSLLYDSVLEEWVVEWEGTTVRLLRFPKRLGEFLCFVYPQFVRSLA